MARERGSGCGLGEGRWLLGELWLGRGRWLLGELAREGEVGWEGGGGCWVSWLGREGVAIG